MEAGLSFEWLGAYIATVSEKTRQAPELIGTAFNSMMSRLHTIRKTGFNEEDETQINDISKALASLPKPIALINKETGQWRDMSDILAEVAAQWDNLSSKEQGYITTTMAGMRQRNTFLALMRDMAKGAEGGSRAYELYAGALDSAGNAQQKYLVYMESVAAAQDNLTNATHEFYSLLDANWMKGFYDSAADLVRIFAAGTEATNGLNISIAALLATIVGITAVIQKLKAAGGVAALLGSFTGVGAVLAAIAAVAGVATMVVGAFSQASKPIDYSEQIQNLEYHKEDLATLTSEYEALAAQQSLTETESKRMNEILVRLSGSSLTLKDALTTSTGGFVTQTEAIEEMNKALREAEIRLYNMKREAAGGALKDLTGLNDARTSLNEAKLKEDLVR